MPCDLDLPCALDWAELARALSSMRLLMAPRVWDKDSELMRVLFLFGAAAAMVLRTLSAALRERSL